MESRSYNPLKLISQSQAIKNANAKIKESMVNLYPGLRSRWKKLNYVVGGAFRFGETFYILGSSGSGKSYILNMLRDDFASQLNENYPKPFKILSFSFEMTAADEIIRTYSGKLETSYSELISSHEKISKEYYEKIIETSKGVDNDIVYYVETSGNRAQILSTIEAFHQQFPNHKLVITIDHTLLMEYLDENSETELVTKLAKLALNIKKKYGALVIILGQLNDNIESNERINNPSHHYPRKSDIFSSRQVYQMADTVMIVHRPERIGIQNYGTQRFPTEGLVAWHILKSRFQGAEGLIRFRQNFNKGTLDYPYERDVKLN